MAWGGLFLSWSRPSPEQQKACISSAGGFNYPSDFHCATSNPKLQTDEKHKALTSNGFSINRARILLGSGPETFRLAKSALLSWRHFALGWAMVDPETPVKKETRFCVCVKELVPWLMMPLEIAYVTSTVKRPAKGSFSFGSGTLQGHLLAGEERFSVEWDEDNKVWYEIVSFSKPADILSVIGYPYVLLRQKYFAQQSTQAMVKFVNSQKLESGRS
ncbi:outer envelope protein [Rhynchospora pubera]|uniref:Outer envelope protein n=1 Tax=Rhynchospora pubera TaxID=906938 RepID=A0AAV8E617_9POAL|nr:outer envelope protein [Rhynchospora pubera]